MYCQYKKITQISNYILTWRHLVTFFPKISVQISTYKIWLNICVKYFQTAGLNFLSHSYRGSIKREVTYFSRYMYCSSCYHYFLWSWSCYHSTRIKQLIFFFGEKSNSYLIVGLVSWSRPTSKYAIFFLSIIKIAFYWKKNENSFFFQSQNRYGLCYCWKEEKILSYLLHSWTSST